MPVQRIAETRHSFFAYCGRVTGESWVDLSGYISLCVPPPRPELTLASKRIKTSFLLRSNPTIRTRKNGPCFSLPFPPAFTGTLSLSSLEGKMLRLGAPCTIGSRSAPVDDEGSVDEGANDWVA